MNKRQIGLWGALAATLAATWWASTVPSEEPAEPATELRAAPARASRAPAQGVDLAPLAAARPAFADTAPPVFGVPPPPPPSARRAADAAPVRPRAPAMPFSYVGALTEADGQRTVFLLDGDRLVTARVGEVIAGRYRLDTIDEHGLSLTYLPLKETQRISLATAP
ncbi:hypothetical protein [Denitromonas iodatirespirans]|uniref:Secretion system X translation initiation factor n=1 Tax=Denitromonas iodatirespirans TaxID=2795389 RepID=A0A944DCU7_DENI1|nr:hypothetical protein [Denitromonas iodatirespirans]MBT0962721.1 hypothetical protein [Denitromonas iodatirespirans]